MGGARITTERFMREVQEIHAGKYYEYDPSWEYDGSFCKIPIKCRWHGWFETTAVSHRVAKTGCPTCAREKMSRRGRVIQEGKVFKRQDANDLRVAKHIKEKCPSQYMSLMKCYPEGCFIKMVCTKHGTVSYRYGATRTHQKWCEECNAESRKTPTREWVRLFQQTHGDEYIYDNLPKESFIGRDKVEVVCRVHGVFKINARNHKNGTKCAKCMSEKWGQSIRKDWAHQIRSGLPDHILITPDDKILGSVRVDMVCPDHGDYSDYPWRILQGVGCTGCNSKEGHTGGYNTTLAGSLYYIKIDSPQGIYYKVGVTNRDNVTERFHSNKRSMITVLYMRRWSDGNKALEEERRILSEHRQAVFTSEPVWWSGGGWTEMFDMDVLGLDI